MCLVVGGVVGSCSPTTVVVAYVCYDYCIVDDAVLVAQLVALVAAVLIVITLLAVLDVRASDLYTLAVLDKVAGRTFERAVITLIPMCDLSVTGKFGTFLCGLAARYAWVCRCVSDKVAGVTSERAIIASTAVRYK
jgi:hypothetical protein